VPICIPSWAYGIASPVLHRYPSRILGEELF